MFSYSVVCVSLAWMLSIDELTFYINVIPTVNLFLYGYCFLYPVEKKNLCFPKVIEISLIFFYRSLIIFYFSN